MIAPCIILAGGMGTRLSPILNGSPKALANICGEPFLRIQIKTLIQAGLNDFILSLGHLSDQLVDFIETNKDLPCTISYAIEDEPLGTGGAILHTMNKYELDEAFVINGDSFIQPNISKLQDGIGNNSVCLSLISMNNSDRYGVVEVSNDSVISFKEKAYFNSGLINAGFYLIKRDIFSGFNIGERFSIEENVLNAEAAKGKISFTILDGFFCDIGIPEDYNKFCKYYNEIK